MKEARLIKEHVAPILEAHDFDLVYSDNKCHVFRNSQQSIRISFIQNNRCPVELTNQYLKYIEKNGPKKPPKALTVSYSVKATLRESNFPVDLLHLDKSIITALFYYDTSSFLDAIQNLLRQSIDLVLPCLELISTQAIFIHDAPYNLLANQPAKQAKEFAQKYNVSMTDNPLCAYNNVKTAFSRLAPNDLSCRKQSFFANLHDISGFAAYIGEIILKIHPGKWGYLEPLPGVENLSRYGLILEDIVPINDIMWYIVESWNYTPLIDYSGIYERSFRELFF